MTMVAYRPLQYKGASGAPLGTWGRVALGGAPVCTCEQLLDIVAESTTNRRALCVTTVETITAAKVERLLQTPHFMLLLLPSQGEFLSATAEKEMREIEKMLLDRHSSAAIAFGRQNANTDILLRRIREDDDLRSLATALRLYTALRNIRTSSCQRLKSQQAAALCCFFLVAEASALAPMKPPLFRPFISAFADYVQEWKPVQTVKGLTLTAWLRGQPDESESHAPTLVFVAHHDAFACVPHFATAVSSSASGLAVLLALARELRKLFAEKQAAYNIAFVVADAGALNYGGVAEWIGSAESSLLNAISYALCLDNLAAHALTLHTPKAYKDPEAVRFLGALERALLAEGIDLAVKTKKLAVGERALPLWPHELFTRAKVIAGTLSAEAEVKHLWNRQGLTDDHLDRVALAKAVRGLAEGTARFLWHAESPKDRLTFRDGSTTVPRLLAAWQQRAAASPRFVAYRHLEAYQGSNASPLYFLEAIEAELHDVGLVTERHEFEVDMAGFGFSYEPPISVMFAEARSTFFDWLVLLSALLYCLIIYLVIRGGFPSGSAASYLFAALPFLGSQQASPATDLKSKKAP
ncbi:uncharacterized protein LOC34618914 [Cyclospora cayetanensis]|uniref:Uncharacterized protein LOC34618914 n=1 Tax=Cyclospora cayetanensis TaxID=88456 RepID=A0A6P6RQE7_9EIME|nr:uncharacterized protein LOC34618914 [Cyclospora cayetanensis]